MAFGGELGRSECPDDYVEPLIWIVLIQAHLKILRHRSKIEHHRAPFDVEDAVRGVTRH
jgi:hypothetical protein